jgi:hypothetical protein
MNFSLQKIEAHLEEEVLLHAEQLLDEDAVRNLQEMEKHFWVAKVEAYEVEVKITPSKVSAATCECETYRASGQCGHIAAVLLSLRQKQTKPQKRKKNKKKNTSTRLTTGTVLKQVEHEDLVAFVKQYAKTNRNFALALKARFAPSVSSIDSREKYMQLLDSTINAARRPDRTFSSRGGKKIYKVLLEIQHQIEESIAQDHLAEAVTMAQTIIEKMTPLLRKLEGGEDEIRGQIKEAFRALREVLSASPPPALRDTIWDYCLEECKKLLYRNNKIDQYFFRLLMQMADETEQKEALLELLDEQITRYFFEKRELAQLLLFKLTLLEKLDRADEVQAFINQHITNDEVLTFAVRQAMQNGNLHRAKVLAQSGLESASSPATIAAMENTLLEIAREEDDEDSIVHYAERRLESALDLKFYRVIKETFQGNWQPYRQHLLSEIQALPFSTKKLHLIAAIYLEDELHGELLAFLKETKSLDLARDFGAKLLPQAREDVYQFYNELFTYYLSQHVGRKPSEKIRAILLQLHETGAEELAEKLVQDLRAKFPERHSLMEELEVF